MKIFFRFFMTFNLALVITVTFAQSHVLPFFEWWDQGTFAYNDWELVPVNSNWVISISEGNPMPCADFTSAPVHYNYSLSLETPLLYTWYYYSCAKFWCDFDYKLLNLNSTGNEKLYIDIFIEGEWKSCDSLSNTGDKDWTPMHVYLSESSDTVFKVRFRAQGANSADILHWYIDNIKIYVRCNPPLDLAVKDVTDRQVTLTWNPPECGNDGISGNRSLMGYNIFRTEDPMYVFIKLNTALITDTNYIDIPADYQEYCYYVTSVFELSYGFTCQSDSSNLVCAEVVNGINDLNIGKISIYPNPAEENVIVSYNHNISTIELFNYTGQKVFSIQNANKKNVMVNVSAMEPGVYFIRIFTEQENTMSKIIIARH